MIRNVAEYLENTAKLCPEKVAFVDERRSITFKEIREEARHLATALINLGANKKPIIVYMDKCVECVCAFMGVVESGNFYSPIDTQMPVARIEKIVNTLEPYAIITDKKHVEEARKIALGSTIFVYEEELEKDINHLAIDEAMSRILDSDLLYVLFTSGSTGVPKGVMISERGVIDFAEWATEYFNIDDTFVFGNQTPFYFSFSIYEIYLTLKNAATTYIIPQECFSYPAQLMQYMYDKKINTVVWVPSALCMISTFHALESPYLPELRRVLFGAEVMPAKHLNEWRRKYPEVLFCNLFGPTEVTDTCSAYIISREIQDTEALPIGLACRNKEMLLLNDEDKEASYGEVGEICIRGSGLAYGYYNDPERTAEVFVQNPLNKSYSEIIYRTGDLAKYNEYGEMIYVSRKDFQIKHMGRRIELGEIETVVAAIEGVNQCCALYDSKKSRINMFYTGVIEKSTLSEKMKELLPVYMLPGKILFLDNMPRNLNGKIDRTKLKELI